MNKPTDKTAIAVSKRIDNRTAEMLNSTIKDESLKTTIIPLTAEEEYLCKRFDEYVNLTTEKK